MDKHSTGYKITFTNLVAMYEEELSDYEVRYNSSKSRFFEGQKYDKIKI